MRSFKLRCGAVSLTRRIVFVSAALTLPMPALSDGPCSAWTDLGRNVRLNGTIFNTSNGTHYATDGTNLYLLEGSNGSNLDWFNPATSRYEPRAALPDSAQDGGEFQYGEGVYYAGSGVGLNLTDGTGNAPPAVDLSSDDELLGRWRRLPHRRVLLRKGSTRFRPRRPSFVRHGRPRSDRRRCDRQLEARDLQPRDQHVDGLHCGIHAYLGCWHRGRVPGREDLRVARRLPGGGSGWLGFVPRRIRHRDELVEHHALTQRLWRDPRVPHGLIRPLGCVTDL